MREHRIGERVHLHRKGASRRARRLGLRDGSQVAAHVVTGLRPRFDDAAVLEPLVGLQYRGHADALLPGQAAHRGDAVTGAQRARADQLVDLFGNLLVERHGGSSQAAGAPKRHSCAAPRTGQF
jgi:hypothetical protein